MDTELVRLDDNDTEKHGRRYTQVERDAAYLLWRTVAGRSARKVGQRLGIGHDTIASWVRDDDWPARADVEDADDYASFRIATMASTINEVVPSIETVKQIRDDPSASNKDRLMAAFWLAGLGGVSPVSKIESAVTDNRPTVVPHLPDFSTMSHDELRAYEEQVRKQRQRKTMVATERLRT